MLVDVIIPALNEEETVADIVRAVLQTSVRGVIVVDNGSRDATAQRARAAGATVVAEQRRGYGAACHRGLVYAASQAKAPEVVVFMAADGADDPSDLPALIREIEVGADLALGSRVLGRREVGSMPFVQKWGNALATTLLRARHGMHYSDLGPFRAARLAALRTLDLRDRGFGWTVEMQVCAQRAGLRVVEVPVRCRRRRGGDSKISGTFWGSVRAGARILYEALRAR